MNIRIQYISVYINRAWRYGSCMIAPFLTLISNFSTIPCYSSVVLLFQSIVLSSLLYSVSKPWGIVRSTQTSDFYTLLKTQGRLTRVLFLFRLSNICPNIFEQKWRLNFINYSKRKVSEAMITVRSSHLIQELTLGGSIKGWHKPISTCSIADHHADHSLRACVIDFVRICDCWSQHSQFDTFLYFPNSLLFPVIINLLLSI